MVWLASHGGTARMWQGELLAHLGYYWLAHAFSEIRGSAWIQDRHTAVAVEETGGTQAAVPCQMMHA